MRKRIALVIALVLLLTLCACTSDSSGGETAQDPRVSTVPVSKIPDEYIEQWDGDWYGWWGITRSSGSYAEMSNGAYWWDVCARIDVKDGTLVLWDELTGKEEPLADMKAYISMDNCSEGCLVVGNGTFINMKTGPSYWFLSPTGSMYSDAISITGRYDDPNDPGSYIEYYMLLCPWGTLWEDISEDVHPYHYADWYVPLINKKASMPDTIA